ncbi:MAG: MaoC family dehydratase N-terminal domain-containing protein [Acidobacteriota bacterium]|nr:MaoC family dehydratase N-terminal domain-containing protein [Acidobacteriota bacterium]
MTLRTESIRLSTTGSYEGRVDEDAAVAFALAINDPNPRYLDGRAVHPLYTAALVGDAQAEAQTTSGALSAVAGHTGSVHGQHDLYLWRPVRPGMRLRWAASTFSARQRSTGVVVVERILVTDQDGAALSEHFWSNFYIGGTIAAGIGPDTADHTFPPEGRHEPMASAMVRVDRDQTFRYAGASGDHVGHAMDDEIARSEGYPGKILQGMCSFGLACGPLVDLLAAGDPDRLHRLAVRFSSPAFPNRELEVRAYKAGISSDGGPAYAFETEQAGAMVHTHGRVELRA